MYKLVKITELAELQVYLDKGMIGKGTFSTGKFALEQGKSTFVAVNYE